jgi:hypothetical protein
MILNAETRRTTDTRFIIRAGSQQALHVACDWEARFKCRPHFVRNEIRIQFSRKCRFSGESFDRAWANTGRFVGSTVIASLSQKKTNISASQICASRVTKLLAAAGRLSDSYNKLLIQASAEYCARVLKGLREGLADHVHLLGEIRKLTSQEQDLLSQYAGNRSDVSLLGLQVFEDRFMSIQEEAERLGIFPRLSNIPIDQLFERQEPRA